MSTHNELAKKKNMLRSFSNLVVNDQKEELTSKQPLSNRADELGAKNSIDSASDGMEIEEQPARTRRSNIGSTVQKNQKPGFLDALIEFGVIDSETVDRALEIQKSSKERRRLIDILIIDLGVESDEIYKSVSRYYSFETVDPTPVFGDKDRLQFIKQTLQTLPPLYYEMAVRRKVLPYEIYANGVDKLIIITPDTTHPEVHAVARAFQFQKYEIKSVHLADWNELWRQLAFDQGAKQLGLNIDEEFAELDKNEYRKELERSVEDEVGQGKLSEVIESILVDGERTGASDIHVIPKGSHRTEFHFRIDGRLSLWSAITDVRSESILAVIKDRAKNLDRFEKFLSQDGFAQRTIDNKVVRFRFSTMPIYNTDLRSKVESIVIRILRSAETMSGIESLGMPKHSLELFNKAIRKPQGIVIFTGPTGSGKTTSQVAAIKTIMDPGINIITIEDPVEYIIEGCRQVKLNHKLDFEGALRGLLRHDPDVVMVGEMRDRATADIAVKLANTGHLIFSTLHTNDSISAITRLYNMGIEPFLLAYTVNIVIAQRLVRKLCERCKAVDTNLDIEALTECGFTEQEIKEVTFYKPVGCVQCVKGYRGRIGIFETFAMSKEARKTILKSKDFIDEDALRTAATQQGMHTLRQSAVELLKQGITSVECVLGFAADEDL